MTITTERPLSGWLAQAKGRRVEHNYVKTADCTDVSNDVLFWCFPRRFRSALDRTQGHGKDVARNMASRLPDLYRLEQFDATKRYPLGTIFSCRPPAWEEKAARLAKRTIYGHTGVLLGQGVGQRQPVAQQDTYKNVPCWVAPSVSRYPITEVAVPLFADPVVSLDQLVRDTLAGKYGSGEARKKALGARYAEVQAAINARLKAPAKPAATPAPKPAPRPMLHRLVRTKTGVPPHAVAFRANGTPYDHHTLPDNLPVYPTGVKRGIYVQVKVARFGGGYQTQYRLGSTCYVHPVHLVKTNTPL